MRNEFIVEVLKREYITSTLFIVHSKLHDLWLFATLSYLTAIYNFTIAAVQFNK